MTDKAADKAMEAAASEIAVRTPADFAIEFAEYMAEAAEDYMVAIQFRERDGRNDAHSGLISAVYEFRKRARAAKTDRAVLLSHIATLEGERERMRAALGKDRSDYISRGWREAMKWAVTYVHGRAKQMNDDGARAALNVVASDLGEHIDQTTHNARRALEGNGNG